MIRIFTYKYFNSIEFVKYYETFTFYLEKLQFIERSLPKSLTCGGMNCSICGLCFDWYNDGGWKRRDTGDCCGDVRCFYVLPKGRRRYIYHSVSIGVDDDHSPAICSCNRTSENVQ